MPLGTLGALGSLSKVEGKITSKPSPRPKKRGKGLTGQGRTGKEGAFSTLRDWLLKEKEAIQATAKDQERLEEGSGKGGR